MSSVWTHIRARAEAMQRRVDVALRPHDFDYKRTTSIEQRRISCQRARKMYPDRVPVVLERGSTECPTLDRFKFLIPTDMTVAQFQHVVRFRLRMDKEHALLLFINNTVPMCSERMGILYDRSHDGEDGFLYMRYDKERAFG